MEPIHPEQENRTPETEIKALPIPNQWKLWRWRPKDRKSFLFGLGFLALYDTIFALLGWALFEYVVED